MLMLPAPGRALAGVASRVATSPADASDTASARARRLFRCTIEPAWRRAASAATGRSLGFAPGAGQPPCELNAGADAELAVDVAEVELDRLDAHEERRRDFLVGLPLGDELRHLPFGGRQLPARRRPAAEPGDLPARTVRPEGAPSR